MKNNFNQKIIQSYLSIFTFHNFQFSNEEFLFYSENIHETKKQQYNIRCNRTSVNRRA